MLLFVFKGGIEVSWRVKDTPPHKKGNVFGPRGVEAAWADGEELTYIYSNFKNLPIPDQRRIRVVWTGDMAEFIYNNL
jgi:hypothetical protein